MLVFQLALIFIIGRGFGAQLVFVSETQLFPTSLQSFIGTSSTKLITCFCCCRSYNQKVCINLLASDLSAGLINAVRLGCFPHHLRCWISVDCPSPMHKWGCSGKSPRTPNPAEAPVSEKEAVCMLWGCCKGSRCQASAPCERKKVKRNK